MINAYKIILFLKIMLLRGVGSITYSMVAVALIPSNKFSEIVYILPVLEFFSGMLFPVLRTAIVSKRISSSVAFIAYVSVGLCVQLYVSLYLTADVYIAICTLIIILLVPFVLCSSAELEIRDIGKSLKVEYAAATSAALMAAILIFLGGKFESIDFFISPLLRGALFPLFFLLIIDFATLKKSISFELININKNINKNIFVILRGVDYLFIISLIKSNLLASLRLLPFGSDWVKYSVIAYDLLSAFVAYLLRSHHAGVKFNSKAYLSGAKLFLLSLLAISISACVFGFFVSSDYLSIFFYSIAFVFLFLAMSGATTAVIIGNTFDYILILVLLFFGLIFFRYEISYSSLIVFFNVVMALFFFQIASALKRKKVDVSQ